MKHHQSILAFLLCLYAPAVVLAIDDEGSTVPPVVISDTRTEKSVGSSASSVTVITAKEIQERQLVNVGDALRHVVGVDVRQTGGPGTQSSVFIRGANSQHTLVMIDGVQVNHPSIGGFDFADLTTENIERIEIVRGPQSTLYGSDAMGGVINIVTRKGSGPPSVSYLLEGGRYDTGRGVFSVSGSSDSIDYSAALSHSESAGFSHAAAGTEPDSYMNTTLSVKLGTAIGGDGRAELTGRYTLAQDEVDGFGPVDDANAWQRRQELVVALSEEKPLTTWWNQRLVVSTTRSQYVNKFFDAVAFPAPTYVINEFDARTNRLDWQHDLVVAEPVLLTFGSEYEGQMGENSGDPSGHTMNTYALFIQTQVTLPEGLSLVTGVRRDANNRFGSVFTYKTAIAYLYAPTQTKVRASLGTGFHAPSFQDLYFPLFANPNLRAESSQTAEAGIEQAFWNRRLVIDVTHFRTLFDDLIQFAFDPVNCDPILAPVAFCPLNVAQARSEGQEVIVTIAPIPQATFMASYTHTTAKDTTTDMLLVRRPRSKASFGVTVKPIAALVLTADVDFVGRRLDTTGAMAGRYWLARATGSYAVTRALQIFGRIENATDKDYQDVLGFNTSGRALYGGVRGTFN